MTVCNMTIEAGARTGLIAVDDKTIEYVKGRPFAPTGEIWDKAVAYWNTLHSDEGAHFDKEVFIDASHITPQVTWGTSPEMVISVTDHIPQPTDMEDPIKRASITNALSYMGLTGGEPITSIPIDKVFIGSCTNSRIEDLREAASVVKGKQVAENVV